ncbi:MAG: hypothetical protein ABIJ52_18045 [Pseudomonadota bacterium]
MATNKIPNPNPAEEETEELTTTENSIIQKRGEPNIVISKKMDSKELTRNIDLFFI